jgi:hypothetical protein
MATIEQLDANLPNGLHDAHLLGVEIDYEARQVVMHLDVLVNSERKPEYRRGTLTIIGVEFLAIDPPGPNAVLSSSKPSRIDAGSGQPSTAAINLPGLPPDCFLHWFFVNEWNGFIRVAAKDATWRWLDQSATPGRT